MSKQSDAQRAAKAVLAELRDRKGFDWWWEDLDAATMREIRAALAARIEKAYAPVAARVEELETVARLVTEAAAAVMLLDHAGDGPVWRARVALGLDGATGEVTP